MSGIAKLSEEAAIAELRSRGELEKAEAMEKEIEEEKKQVISMNDKKIEYNAVANKMKQSKLEECKKALNQQSEQFERIDKKHPETMKTSHIAVRKANEVLGTPSPVDDKKEDK